MPRRPTVRCLKLRNRGRLPRLRRWIVTVFRNCPPDGDKLRQRRAALALEHGDHLGRPAAFARTFGLRFARLALVADLAFFGATSWDGGPTVAMVQPLGRATFTSARSRAATSARPVPVKGLQASPFSSGALWPSSGAGGSASDAILELVPVVRRRDSSSYWRGDSGQSAVPNCAGTMRM
jgi:hypothetical protein